MTLERARKLLEYYDNGLIPTLAKHEVNPGLALGSRENYLYFTLPVSLNFQRNSPAMWRSALATYEDKETRFVFFPEELVERSPQEIQTALLTHKLALQPVKHVHIWTTISHTLNEYYENDPRVVIAEANSDAGEFIKLLQITHRKRFPYLSGPKLSNYWAFILSLYTDVRFNNIQEISIIPDTHVLQSSAELGLAPAGTSVIEVEAIWKNLLQNSEITPSRMHSALWNWSRNKFQPAV